MPFLGLAQSLVDQVSTRERSARNYLLTLRISLGKLFAFRGVSVEASSVGETSSGKVWVRIRDAPLQHLAYSGGSGDEWLLDILFSVSDLGGEGKGAHSLLAGPSVLPCSLRVLASQWVDLRARVA